MFLYDIFDNHSMVMAAGSRKNPNCHAVVITICGNEATRSHNNNQKQQPRVEVGSHWRAAARQ